ncbi:MAG TPA: hypothetical protein VGE74_31595 [Gemmata sp.]
MSAGNRNVIVTATWSNPGAAELYALKWPTEPQLREQCEQGNQCGGCSFFAPFNEDWGLCAARASRHHLETVFEHFTCPAFVNEGWGPHSFSAEREYHCRCGGEGSEYWDQLAAILTATGNPPAPTNDPPREK